MLEARRTRSAPAGRYPADGPVEADMGLFPVEETHELGTKRIGRFLHAAIIARRKERRNSGSSPAPEDLLCQWKGHARSVGFVREAIADPGFGEQVPRSGGGRVDLFFKLSPYEAPV